MQRPITCSKVREGGNSYERHDGLGGILIVVQRMRIRLQPRYPENPFQPPLQYVFPLVPLAPMVRPPCAPR